MPKHAPKLGVFGGTFNPIHNAHLRLAEDVREEFSLDRVLFIPTNLPPHKSVAGEIEAVHRLRMVQLAALNNPHFECNDIELKRGGVSYTIDTVSCLYEEYGLDEKPYIIIGSDLVSEIDSWRKIDSLVRKVRFIVLKRDGFPVEKNGSLPGALAKSTWYSFDKRTIDITSSEIRKRVMQGKSIRYLVPEVVLEYIKEKGLYQQKL